MKKNYFIITSIILIMLCTIVIAFSGKIAQNTIDSMNEAISMFNELESELSINRDESIGELDSNKEESLDFFDSLFDSSDEDRLNELFGLTDENFMTGYYQRIIIAESITIIIMSAITIIIAKNNHILRHKKRIVAYSIFTMILGTNILINLIGLINLIVILVLKRKDEEDYPIPKEKIIPLEKTYRSKKEIILGVLAIVCYVFLYVIVRKALNHFCPNLMEDGTISILLELFIDIIVLAIILAIYKEELLNGLKAVKGNFTHYRRFIRKRFIITLLLSMLANIIRFAITKNATSENQFSLFELPMWYLAPVAVIWAPIVEECIFRGSFKRIIPNKYVFIIVSGVVFGVLHAISESNIFDMMITSIPYCIIGLSFAMAYEKSNNIITNIAMHALNNFIAIVLMLVVLGA